MENQSKIYEVQHLEPRGTWLNFIILPYGEYYKQTREIAKAKKGDILRFFQGKDYTIERVMKIRQDDFCDMLSRIAYGIPWKLALKKWQSYAVLTGSDRGVINSDYCLWVIYGDLQNKRELLGEDPSA